jgi:hypothetical protein
MTIVVTFPLIWVATNNWLSAFFAYKNPYTLNRANSSRNLMYDIIQVICEMFLIEQMTLIRV